MELTKRSRRLILFRNLYNLCYNHDSASTPAPLTPATSSTNQIPAINTMITNSVHAALGAVLPTIITTNGFRQQSNNRQWPAPHRSQPSLPIPRSRLLALVPPPSSAPEPQVRQVQCYLMSPSCPSCLLVPVLKPT